MVETNRQQNPMETAKQDLRNLNRELGGLLFTEIGRGGSKVSLFPIPLTIPDDEMPEAEVFLFDTHWGCKAIQVERTRGEEIGVSANQIQEIIEEYFKQDRSHLSDGAGYSYGKLELTRGLSISPDGTICPDGKVYPNCTLIEINEDMIEDILRENIEGAEIILEQSRRISAVIDASRKK